MMPEREFWENRVVEYLGKHEAEADLFLEAYFRKKIRKANLPDDLVDFSEDEIKALRWIASKSTVQLACYASDFKKVKNVSEGLWKWLVISLAAPELEKRLHENLKRYVLEEYVHAPWDWEDQTPFLDTIFAHRNSQSVHRKFIYPFIFATWWEPMGVNDYVWGTGTYRAKVKKYLDGIGAVPETPAAGSRPARYSVETNLAVMEVWLERWEKPERLDEICIFLRDHLERIKMKVARDDTRGTALELDLNGLPRDKKYNLPFEDEILDLIGRYSDE